MSCLTVDQIYLYLEGELAADERRAVDHHTAACEKCRASLEERRILLQAAESLPAIDVPADFSCRIMEVVFPPEVSARSWIGAAFAGFSTVAITFLLVFLLSGKNL